MTPADPPRDPSAARLAAAARQLLSPDVDHPKSWVVGRFPSGVERALVGDPLVVAWLAATHPISAEMAAHLARLTGTPVEDWREAERRHLADGGLVLPARVVFAVLAVEPLEDDLDLAVVADLALARAVADAYDRSGHGGGYRHAAIRWSLCWGAP